MNVVELWRLLVVPVARLMIKSVVAIRSLGGSTACPLIDIRGPNFSQLLLIILSSSAIVANCAGDAWLMSIVNFFNLVTPYIVLESCG